MSRPYNSPNIRNMLGALLGAEITGNTPGWMDRKFGYVPKKMKGRNHPKQKPKTK